MMSGQGRLMVKDQDYLKKLPPMFDEHGRLIIYRYADLKACDPIALRMFCHYFARYTIPTVELLTLLKELIGDTKAIEIGAGCGDLGWNLGIPMTDNHLQTRPDIEQMYAATGQPTIEYGKDVEKLEALAAVRKYKPHTVIASWVTHWINPNKPPPKEGGSAWGIKEGKMLNRIKRYIHIGSYAVHDIKPIRKRQYEIIDGKGIIISRSNREDDQIWIWKGRG